MNKIEIEESVKAIIEEMLSVEDVDLEADLQQEYDVDSIGLMDFIMSVEDTFGIRFHDEDLEKMTSVQDVIDKVEEML